MNKALHAILLVLAMFMVLPSKCYSNICTFEDIFINNIKSYTKQVNFGAIALRNNVEAIDMSLKQLRKTGADKGRIRGYKIIAKDNIKGFFLILPGNAQPMKTIINNFLPIAASGYDVIGYDYEGIGESDGITSMNNLVEDTSKIIALLKNDNRYKYKRAIIYAISSGGIFALQQLKILNTDDSIILDSTPDKLPFILWCDSYIHPQRAILAKNITGLHILLIHGKHDSKVVPENSSNLIKYLSANGGCHNILTNGYHPFEDRDNIGERITLILNFIKTQSCITGD